ncbi:MAG: peptidoglycan DL-endopeptidase CwlO [Trebonia sp.]|nr:peptidoglycan DL-endopeptidase CwlO [Trebonia sp.]
MRLTGIVPQTARATGRIGRRRVLSAGVVILAALGTLAGVLAAVLSGAPSSDLAAQLPSGLPAVRPATGDAPVITGEPLTLAADARPVPDSSVPAVMAGTGQPTVAPLRRTVQADLLIVAPSSLPAGLVAAVSRLPGMVAAVRIEAVRMRVNGAETAVVGVDPSQFRSFAARPTGAADALWQGVANGGIAVSYTMGKLDKVPLGGSVLAGGRTAKRLHVVAFGTLGIGGVNAVVSDATARALGAPAGNAIVVSVRTGNFTADSAAIGRLLPKGAGVEPLASLVNSGAAGAGSATAPVVPAVALDTMLKAAMSRRGLPYVWGAAGPTSFDCSGLVQWSFAQAGIVMPRVAADQALSGPPVPVSQLEPGDLLFYDTDPTAPHYISHVAIYLGNGWMILAPEPGMDVEVVPAAFGSEFAGAIRVTPAQAASVASGIA